MKKQNEFSKVLYEEVKKLIEDCSLLSKMGKTQCLKILDQVKSKHFFTGKPEVWAGAIVYTYFRLILAKASANSVAQHFNVSQSYLFSKFKMITKSLRLKPFDERFVHPTTVIDKLRHAYYFLPQDVFRNWVNQLKDSFFAEELKKSLLKIWDDFRDAFKQYFGHIDAYFKDGIEMEHYLNDFLVWRFREWRNPLFKKSEEEIARRFKIYKEPLRITLRDDLKHEKNLGIVVARGDIFVLKGYYELYSLIHGTIPPSFSNVTMMKILEREDLVPTPAFKVLLSEYKERMLDLFKMSYPSITTMKELTDLVSNIRHDWSYAEISRLKLPEEVLEELSGK
ncbi:MAG: hypothetical protein ACP6IS_12540 [Candidatus Asgardarchaeia archaeon]